MKRLYKGSRVCSLRSEQCSLPSVAVAHDHGYGYLQTKDVSGAVFESASDGVFVRSNESGFWLAIGLTSKKTGGEHFGSSLGTKKKL